MLRPNYSGLGTAGDDRWNSIAMGILIAIGLFELYLIGLPYLRRGGYAS